MDEISSEVTPFAYQTTRERFRLLRLLLFLNSVMFAVELFCPPRPP